MSYSKLKTTCITRSSCPEVFLEISQNSQENTCARVSFFTKTSGGCFCITKNKKYLSLEKAKISSNALVNSQFNCSIGLDVLQKKAMFKDTKNSPQSTKGGIYSI